jgi:hypothetical protein
MVSGNFFFRPDFMATASATSQLITFEGMERHVKRKDVLSKVTPLEQFYGRILEVTDV